MIVSGGELLASDVLVRVETKANKGVRRLTPTQ